MPEESFNLTRSDLDVLLSPWYHDFSVLGLKAQQRGGIFPANQKCKEPVLFPLIAEALRLCRRRGQGTRGVELFCADGFFGMYAIHVGAESMRALDLDERELIRGRLAARLLGMDGKMTFANEDVYRLEGEFDFCICAGGLYHVRDPAALLLDLARKVHGPMVVQTVISLAQTGRDYFETPAPGLKWGCRFSYAFLQDMVTNAGWAIVEKTQNELTGNDRPEDRGSAYLLCVPPSFVKDGLAQPAAQSRPPDTFTASYAAALKSGLAKNRWRRLKSLFGRR